MIVVPIDRVAPGEWACQAIERGGVRAGVDRGA
jgi:hypothetical protein